MGAALPGPGGDGGQPPAPRPEPPPPSPPGLQQERVGNLLFVLKGCSLSGKLVQCNFLVTNSGEDATVELYHGGSRLFDGEGNEYHAVEAILGSSKVLTDEWYPASTRLATGIPVRARLSFDGIPPETQLATLLEVRTNQATLQFRKVPLKRP